MRYKLRQKEPPSIEMYEMQSPYRVVYKTNLPITRAPYARTMSLQAYGFKLRTQPVMFSTNDHDICAPLLKPAVQGRKHVWHWHNVGISTLAVNHRVPVELQVYGCHIFRNHLETQRLEVAIPPVQWKSQARHRMDGKEKQCESNMCPLNSKDILAPAWRVISE